VSARILGVLNTALSITCAVVLALGLSDLAQRRVASGHLALGWVSWASGGPGHVDRAVERSRRGDVARALARHVGTAFHVPQPERERSRGDLGLAIEQASDRPTLNLLRRVPSSRRPVSPCSSGPAVGWRR